MKRKLVLVFAVILLFGFSSFSCFAQSSSNDQRIVGTWIHTDSGNRTVTLVFNANGSGSFSTSDQQYWGNNHDFNYGISMTGSINATSSFVGSNILYFSPDGRTMIFRGDIYRKR